MYKKVLLIVVLAVLCISVTTSRSAAAEPTPIQLEYVDAQLLVFLPKLADYQADYFNVHGQYYQALGSHSVVPAGAEVASDLGSHPTDQDTTLAALWDETGLPASISWSFTVNTWVGPNGAGYTVVISTIVDGAEWQRVIDTGPDSSAWAIVTPPSGG